MTLHTDVHHHDQTMRVVDLKTILGARLAKLPHVLRLLSENHLRETQAPAPLIAALDDWLAKRPTGFEFSFRPNRILMHDTTCTPAIADIAGLRDAIAEAGGDPAQLTPQLPVEVSVDHSLAVDIYANPEAATRNGAREIERNHERYAFMKWASANLSGVHVNPPGTGIMHTINLEQLATLLEINQDGTAHPDMLLGTDSHTPMINGIGVLGWGIGGLEAESVMFGQATTLAVPKVVGVRLVGALRAGVLSTDLALEITHRLRALDVTGAFVEFFGPGVATLTAGDRAVIANMAPEYGASTGFFPVDANSVTYLEQTARAAPLTRAIEPVFRAMGLWFDPEAHPSFDQEIEIDLASLTPVVAGPRRPQDRCAPAQAQTGIETAINRPLAPCPPDRNTVPDGAVGVAAITSCTNTSDPRLLITAGLLARKAAQRGLTVPHWVKTSLAPGSPSARAYLDRAGLTRDLAALGFDIVGFGCTTCIGNSGPLPAVIETALEQDKAVCAVLSGNRNFPGRVHPKLDLGYLASPPLVIAYAIKGRIAGDILSDPLGEDASGAAVYLRDIWPDRDDIDAAVTRAFRADDVPQAFATASGNKAWQDIACPATPLFPWNSASRSLRRPKFASLSETTRLGQYSAAPLLVLGDDMTTDHISPAGWISPDSEAGKWLIARGGTPADLNVYASYRGNWEVMLRGLFTNRLARNYLADDLPAGWTTLKDGSPLPVHRAAAQLAKAGTSAVILAGARYGMGSSRDWAAKGAALLGARAVIARSFERIHRQNLIGMGVVPLVITDGFLPASAGITAADRFDISLPPDSLTPNQDVALHWSPANGQPKTIACRADVQTGQEVALLQAGGVLASILERVLGHHPRPGVA
ncbi:aconitate hydratase AcnA [Marinovum sp. 2_MG-2023]|uniref:aconitate hydratase AcnA n=1 Tax=unclassified Marinovum TaxID=2647166 RepID=UPI0026E320A3|nr:MULTISPECIES: aconitate hydratase AcnA [unclassified Marinovum]MDO6730022.1 aconitate hydratase AcnA [Marinovum sp. 2_MG-2023]MDO6779836.1 aconitate hydratase AcnA [Marinovum sp. 1_MG-2023]